MGAAKRDQLQRALEASIGAEEAAILMEHLPPDRWDELATKDDLDHAVSTLATKEELAHAVSTLATKEELAHAVSTLATKEELAHAVSTLATKEELAHAVSTLATKEELAHAVSTLATKEELAHVDREVVSLRKDMGQLEVRMDLKLDAMEGRLTGLFRERIDHSTRVTVFALMTTMLTSTGLSLGVVMLGN